MRRNVRTTTMKKYLKGMEEAKIRLTKNDKAFLSDLAQVRLVGLKDAMHHHYGGKESCQRRLQKLVEVGLLNERQVIQPGKGKNEKCYEFASDRIARLYGGRGAGIGSKRSDLHELLVSQVYFKLGRPDGFKLGDQMTELEKKAFLQPVRGDGGGITPDAYYEQGGELIFVEADAGQYTKKQVMNKQQSWVGVKQVWVQPEKANCVVPRVGDVEVMRL